MGIHIAFLNDVCDQNGDGLDEVCQTSVQLNLAGTDHAIIQVRLGR